MGDFSEMLQVVEPRKLSATGSTVPIVIHSLSTDLTRALVCDILVVTLRGETMEQ